MSVTLEPPKWKRGAPWGEIDSLYRAKLGWLDDSTFLIVGDEVQYYLRIKDEYAQGEYPGPIRLVTCVRKQRDCSGLENRLRPNALYVQNFQSALATVEEQASKKPVVQALSATPASSP